MHRTVIAVTSLALVAAGCGGSEEGNAAASSAADLGSSTTVLASSESTAAQMEPAELGGRIGEMYLRAIEDLVGLLRDRPSGPAALTNLEELKEGYVQDLVALGRLREALSPAERDAVDAAIRATSGAISQDLFTEYQEIQADYFPVDAQLAELVSSFNIITQYANFDLLAEQEPEEAARLLGG